MTDLDLTSDDPDEFEGRVVRLDGAEYVIGKYLGEGGERFVHELVNRRFGRGTHVILILRNQPRAAEISANALEALQRTRDALGAKYVIHDHFTVRAHGGVFEMREGIERTGTELEMERLLRSGRQAEAVAIAERLLTGNPDNFLALIALAAARGNGGDPYDALELALAALRIEPNTRACKVTLMQCALVANAFQTFWWQYEDLRAKWPNDRSTDDLAASAHMTMGTPDKAVDLKLSDEVAAMVQREVAAKHSADEVMKTTFKLEDSPEHNERNRGILAQAYQLYRYSTYIAVNYGLVLLRSGDGRAAYDVLIRIVPVLDSRRRPEFYGFLAFGLAVDGDWPAAYRMLDLMTQSLGDNDIKPADLPGWPLWWIEDKGAMLYSRTHRPFQLIAQVLRHVGSGQVRPEVRAMALLYAQHPCNP
ncbi:hypothetical protein [Kibdelosporangium phytohabitans]|uniref:Uncharacterized protein n=1 Tax=Kibdelosporangium phytohabitans TaxID=860235 RepID=A0A0N9HTJ6_9PSEU|nr:hypothetical protein [Kibdelosporangium phytohabitans]ALG08469.1 hypothetical protein AOZ06_17495 [Kibdelosporangium phytohabitans]MBE1470469.1 tetratricopeptide (TPR) repeat protein [Kibdelosporangium phytohabitans]